MSDVLVDPGDVLSHDEFDAQQIIDWLETYRLDDAPDIPPVPTSARQGELRWAHENTDAWDLIDPDVLNGYGLTRDQARQLMVSHARSAATAEWVVKTHRGGAHGGANPGRQGT